MNSFVIHHIYLLAGSGLRSFQYQAKNIASVPIGICKCDVDI